MYANPYAYAARRAYGYTPMVAFGATDPNAPSTLDNVKTWLGTQNSIVPVKNGYIVAGAAVVGIGLYAGWFGGKRRRH